METRLQTLRRLRSDRLRPEVDANIKLLQRAGWACSGCGCYMDDYSFDCGQCWDRARRSVDGQYSRPETKVVAAENYLRQRRLVGAEKVRASATRQMQRNPWHGEKPPVGAAGWYGAF
jgi:hypothetical protein